MTTEHTQDSARADYEVHYLHAYAGWCIVRPIDSTRVEFIKGPFDQIATARAAISGLPAAALGEDNGGRK